MNDTTARCTVLTYTVEGLPDDDHPPRVFAGELSRGQIEQLTREDSYPRRAIAEYSEDDQLLVVEPVFVVTYSNLAEATDEAGGPTGPDELGQDSGGSGQQFTPEHAGAGDLMVMVYYRQLERLEGPDA